MNNAFRIPNIIFSSQSTVIDWLMLIHNYAPKFLAIAKSENSKSDFFFELSSMEIFQYSLGLKFPTVKDIKQKRKFDIEKHLESPNQVPLVIFPECTKTNRYGILKIRSNLLDSLYKFVSEHNMTLIRSEIFINGNGDYNTTDVSGLSHLLHLCQRYYTKVEIYSQDIPNDTFSSKNAEFDRKKYPSIELYLDSNLQDYLMEIIHRNSVSLSCFDHIKFIEYFNKTSSDSSYVKDK